MSRLFEQLINKIAAEHELVIEAGPAPEMAPQEQLTDQPIVDDQTVNQTSPEPQSQIEQPENSELPDQQESDDIADSKELLYIQLIYKALITELDPSQYTDMINIKDINSKNAKSVLNKLETIINNNTTIS